MAHRTLLGSDEIPVTPPGHDIASLGPSDTSDSGSDVAGLADYDENDPGLPFDVAAEPDRERRDAETISPHADTDAGGTGERRSAGGDAGRREAADIGPDDIVPRPDTDVDVDDDSPIFDDYPEVDDVDDLSDEDSDSSDYGNAAFEEQERSARSRPAD